MIESCDKIGNCNSAGIANAFERLLEFIMVCGIDTDHASVLVGEMFLQDGAGFCLPQVQKVCGDLLIRQRDLGIERCTQRFPRRLASDRSDDRMLPRIGMLGKKNVYFSGAKNRQNTAR